MSTPRSLTLPDRVSRVTIATSRGAFAALDARPARGVCERRPALLLPGYTGSKEDFLPILQTLASAGRRVVAVDLRGQYETPAAAGRRGYAPDQLAADVAGLAAAIEQGNPDKQEERGPAATPERGVHLLGHSFGGLVARNAVLAGSSGFLSLTLLGSGPAGVPGDRAAALRAALTIVTGTADPDTIGTQQLRERVRRLWDERLGPQAEAEAEAGASAGGGTDPAILTFLRERTLATCPLGLVAMGRYLLSCPDRTAELASLAEPPVLVLYGENDDAWPPSVQDRMAGRLGAQRVCIPGAGHSPAVDAPETTAGSLTAFWNAAESARRPAPRASGQVTP